MNDDDVSGAPAPSIAPDADSKGLACSHFARLPRELRDVIYNYIVELEIDEALVGEYDGFSLTIRPFLHHMDPVTKDIDETLSVVFACKQFRKEVQEVMYDRFLTRIHFHEKGRGGPSSPFDLVHTARWLNVAVDVIHYPNRDQMPISQIKPPERPYSVTHDWGCRRKGMLVRSVFDGGASPEPDQTHDASLPKESSHKLWSRVVAPSQATSPQAPVPFDLEQIYPHRLWSSSFPPYDVQINQACASLFRKVVQGHRLRALSVCFMVGCLEQDYCRYAPFVQIDSRLGRSFERKEIVRSDYGVHPYLKLLSGLREVPRVDVDFGIHCGHDLYVSPYHNDYQSTRTYDRSLATNHLRRLIEDSDEARSLRDFPPGSSATFDECFPILPASTAAEAEPSFKHVCPLDLRSDPLWLFKFRNRRYRLYDDHNIRIWRPLRENTYDCPDETWLLPGRSYDFWRPGSPNARDNDYLSDTDDPDDYDSGGSQGSGSSGAGQLPSDHAGDDARGEPDAHQGSGASESSGGPDDGDGSPIASTSQEPIYGDAGSQAEESIPKHPDPDDGEDTERSNSAAEDLVAHYHAAGFPRNGYSFVFQDSDDSDEEEAG